MSSTKKSLLVVGTFYVASMAVLVAIFGFSRQDNSSFAPQNEFKIDPWVDLPGPVDIDKGTFYVTVAALLTVATMFFIANRMQARPNRVQTAVELVYSLLRDNVAGGNMDARMARRWFPFVATIFLFIWFSNIIGYLPLPTNTEHTFSLFGVDIPSFAIYAATANFSIPLALALIVFIAFNFEGIRAKGLGGYIMGLVPAGVPKVATAPILVLELVSNFMRLLSLSVRLFANILAGHLIILFMSGGLAVLLGLEVLGVFTLPFGVVLFLFEVGLVATLQAFIFATLTAIYLGGAVAEHH